MGGVMRAERAMHALDDGPRLLCELSPDELMQLLADFGYPVCAEHFVVTGELPTALLGEDMGVRLGRWSAGPNGYRDFSFCAAVPMLGMVPPERTALWNRSRRFSRLYEVEDCLVLEMDVTLAGGVSPGYVLQAVERWERTAHELLAFLMACLNSAGEPADRGSRVS